MISNVQLSSSPRIGTVTCKLTLGMFSMLLANTFLTACDAEDPASPPITQAAAEPTPNHLGSSLRTPVKDNSSADKSAPKASLTLGANTYEFDFVACIPSPGGGSSVVASDKAKRTNYPLVRASVFSDPAAASVANTLSADFTFTHPRVLWLLAEGELQKTDQRIIAAGYLKGQNMVDLPNGNQRSESLAGEDRQAFEFAATCG